MYMESRVRISPCLCEISQVSALLSLKFVQQSHQNSLGHATDSRRHLGTGGRWLEPPQMGAGEENTEVGGAWRASGRAEVRFGGVSGR